MSLQFRFHEHFVELFEDGGGERTDEEGGILRDEGEYKTTV